VVVGRGLGDPEAYGHPVEEGRIGDARRTVEVLADIEDELVDAGGQFVRLE
jgi:hypothetical protein